MANPQVAQPAPEPVVAETKTATNIHEALFKCYNAIGYIQKTGKVDAPGTKYTFAGEADFIHALRPILIDNGIIVHCSGITDTRHRSLPRGDKFTYTAAATYEWTFTHVPSGTSIKAYSVGEGNDTSDKATYKMATGALKYALRQTLLIETGNDPDESSGDPAGPEDKPLRHPKTAEWWQTWLKRFSMGLEARDAIEAVDLLEKERGDDLRELAQDYPALFADAMTALGDRRSTLRVNISSVSGYTREDWTIWAAQFTKDVNSARTLEALDAVTSRSAIHLIELEKTYPDIFASADGALGRRRTIMIGGGPLLQSGAPV